MLLASGISLFSWSLLEISYASSVENLRNEITQEWQENNYCVPSNATDDVQEAMQLSLGELLDNVDEECLNNIFTLSRSNLCNSGLPALINYTNMKPTDSHFCNLISNTEEFPRRLKDELLAVLGAQLKVSDLSPGKREQVLEIISCPSEKEVGEMLYKVSDTFPNERQINNHIRDMLLYDLGLKDGEALLMDYLTTAGSLKTSNPKSALAKLKEVPESIRSTILEKSIGRPSFAIVLRIILEPNSPFEKVKSALNDEEGFDMTIIYPKLVKFLLGSHIVDLETNLRDFLLNAHLGSDDLEGILSLLQDHPLHLGRDETIKNLEKALCNRPMLHVELIKVFRQMMQSMQSSKGRKEELLRYRLFEGFDEQNIDESLCQSLESVNQCLANIREKVKKFYTDKARNYTPIKTSNDELFGGLCRKNDFTRIKILGQGSFGIAYLAYHPMNPKMGVVVKKIPSWVVGQDYELIKTEEYFMSRLKHPFIGELHCAFKGDSRHGAYFVMPYYTGGSLSDRLCRGKQYTKEQVGRYGSQILSALRYLHSRRQSIAHLDLKPDNVMLDKPKGDAKLIDFGLAAEFNPETLQVDGDKIVGTPDYMPPEAFLDGEQGPLNDFYALGITLYEMFTGKKPYEMDPNNLGEMASQLQNEGLSIDSGDADIDEAVNMLTTIDPKQRQADCIDQFDSKLRKLKVFEHFESLERLRTGMNKDEENGF